MKPSPEATYERLRRLINVLGKTVILQCRRIQVTEPEDADFVFRRWADYEFLINALGRFRKVSAMALKIDSIRAKVAPALAEFDQRLPALSKMRNTLEHSDEYAIDNGWDQNISRKELEVGTFDENEFNWLGCSLKVNDAVEAINVVFRAIIDSADSLDGRITKRGSTGEPA